MRLELKEKEVDENLSEKEFLKVLNIALKWGFFGMHRIYVKKVFSGILYNFFSFGVILFVFIWHILSKFYSFCDFGNFHFFVAFIGIFVSHLFYIKDLIYIVTGRFKDKEGKVIKKNWCKDENLDDEKISPLDLNILLRLTRLGKGDLVSCFGVYLFYAGHFKKGFLYIVLNILSYFFLISKFFINIKILYIVIFIFVFQLTIYFLVLYDRHLIEKKMFKDKDGKIVCVKRTDEYYFY